MGRVVLNVFGGVVQDVFSDVDDLQVIIVDWDVEGCDPRGPDICATYRLDGDVAEMAAVAELSQLPLADLAGTMAGKMLKLYDQKVLAS